MLLTGADIIIKTLIEQGISTVFGYPGGQIIDVYDSLYKYRDDIRHILTAHEQGAVHAADGFARATGKVGVVIATSGPGATNLVTGIATAFLDSSPLVVICGNVPTYQLGTDGFQEVDITGITLPITKHNFLVDKVESLADTVREAFRTAMSGRKGPVLIDVPKDVQTAVCEYIPQPAVIPDKMKACDNIEEAAECISNAKKPFIYYGGGAVSSGAENEILQLADLIDAPVGCSLMGVSAIPTDHPRFLGMQGMHGRYSSSAAMSEADCIIALGVRFSDRAMGNKYKFADNAKIIHIDIDSAEFNKNVIPLYALRGDVKLTLQAIISRLTKKRHPAWQTRIRNLIAVENESADARDGMTPANIFELLNDYISADMPVATDVGQHQMWAAQFLKFSKGRRFITSGGLGTMGFGLGAAIGASIGTGNRSVLITGDGSFGMSLNELATAITNKIPLVVLVINNGTLGMVRQWQTLFFDKRYSATQLERETDFVSVAKAFGADGARSVTVEELKSALKKAFSSDRTFVIDCVIDKDEVVLPMLPPSGEINDIIVKVGE